MTFFMTFLAFLMRLEAEPFLISFLAAFLVVARALDFFDAFFEVDLDFFFVPAAFFFVAIFPPYCLIVLTDYVAETIQQFSAV